MQCGVFEQRRTNHSCLAPRPQLVWHSILPEETAQHEEVKTVLLGSVPQVPSKGVSGGVGISSRAEQNKREISHYACKILLPISLVHGVRFVGETRHHP
eukprot:scaffold9512_cov181-Amphora_coffeaeformis.AAC.4